MGIFKNITKVLKKAAQVIVVTIGFMVGRPMGSAALGAAFGSGIGTLVGGGDTDEALKAALLGGIGGYAASGGNMFTKAGTSAFGPTGSEMMISPTDTTSVTAIKDAGTSGIMSKIGTFAKENPFTKQLTGKMAQNQANKEEAQSIADAANKQLAVEKQEEKDRTETAATVNDMK